MYPQYEYKTYFFFDIGMSIHNIVKGNADIGTLEIIQCYLPIKTLKNMTLDIRDYE